MDCLAITQHFNELIDFPYARFCFLYVLNPEKDGISVLTVKRRKELRCLGIGVKGALQVFGDSRIACG